MSDTVTYEAQARVAIITLNRPEARNAVNGDVAKGLEAAVDRLEQEDDVWVAVLRANTNGQERPVFCAGADLKAINSGQAAELATERGGFGGFTFRRRRKPVVVAVDGLATAGGLEIVLACDLVVASRRSAFGLAEAKRNLIAGAGGLYRLPRVIGKGPALEAILTGEPIPAERAHELGLVTRLVDDGEAYHEARRLADEITACAPLAVWASLEVASAANDHDEDTLQAMTNEAFGRLLASQDTTEGLEAFIEKRPPRWAGM
ncbi:crotonase/enoyl-CoA hydratase family protein [soil metagenome]